MFQKNKKVLTALLAVSSMALLAGCDKVTAIPANYDEAIILNEDGSKVDVYDNMLGLIYDAIASGKDDKVLDKFLEIVVNDQLGSFDELKALCEGKTSYEQMDAAATDAFIAKHEKTYKRESDATLSANTGADASVIARKRVFDFYNRVMTRVYESLYNEISSSSYQKDGKFLEKKFAYAHFGELYSIKLDRTDWLEGYLRNDLSKEENVKALISLANGNYDDYLNRKVLPSILKSKLVDDYLLNNYYSTLGRSYARKVNTIKISAPSDNKEKQDLPYVFMSSYVNQYVYAQSEMDFDNLANAWRGFRGLDKDGNIIALTDNEAKILTEAGIGDIASTTLPGDVAITYYKNTELGTLLDKWDLVKGIDVDGNRTPDGEEGSNGKVSSALNLFTGSNAHPKEVGLKKELAKLAVVDYTNDGWFVKNGGLTDLPADSIRDRLFNINVSNNLDNPEVSIETGLPSAEFINNFDQTKQYVRKINGKYYLIPDKFEKSSFNTNMIIVNGSDYYIVNIEEAPSTSKLNLENANSYSKMEELKADALFTENVAFEICKVLGNKDSYTNSAYASYMKEYSLVFHDTSVYDYFKEKFSELFEE